MRILTESQRTQEWFDRRAGMLTASVFGTIMTGGPKAWATLSCSLLFPQRQVSVKAMRRGVQLEDAAVARYEIETGRDVVRVGLVGHDTLMAVGASPDGLIRDWSETGRFVGGIEVKCPMNPDIHQDTIDHGMPEHHMPQVQGNIWVCGLNWLDYVSFDPRHPNDPLYIERIARDEAYIATLEEKCRAFLRRHFEEEASE